MDRLESLTKALEVLRSFLFIAMARREDLAVSLRVRF